jgi:hypothetical protein
MADAPVILGSNKERGKPWSPKPEIGWTLLRILGLTFIVAGGIDLALLWYPSRMGTPEFEFATIGQFVTGLPVVTMGMIALAISTVGRGPRGLLMALGLVAILMVGVLAVLTVIYATTVPLAIRSVPVDVKVGIKKSVLKMAVQSVGYGMAYLAIGWTALKASRK